MQTVEKCYKHGIDLYIIFIDFPQAFNSIGRKQLKKEDMKNETARKTANDKLNSKSQDGRGKQ